MLEHVVDAGGEATTGRRPAHGAAGGRGHARRGAAVPPAAGPPRRRLGGGARARSGSPCASGRTTAEPVDAVPALATSAREAGPGRPGRGRRRLRGAYAASSCCSTTGARTRRRRCAAAGSGVRDLRATATALHLDEPTVALLVETRRVGRAWSRRSADGAGNLVWLPTDLFDAWVLRPTAERWTALVRVWLDSPRMPGLVGSRDPAGKTVERARARARRGAHARDPADDAGRAGRAARRARCWRPGPASPSVVALLAWQRPRRPRLRAEQVLWTLTEAAALGVTGLDGLASYARLLLADDDAGRDEGTGRAAARARRARAAPGRPDRGRAGPARVRAGPQAAAGRGGRVARRRDRLPVHARPRSGARWTSAGRRPSCTSSSASVSRTPVPQPLEYLVDDTARTFGTVRVGHAEAYLRADDETALTELLHHPPRPGLGLRRLAPTVLVSSTPLDVLLPRLRDLGAAPVVEADDGTVHVARPDLRRARTPREHRQSHGPVGGGAARAARRTAAVASVVTADPGRRPGRGHPAGRPRTGLDALRLAGRAARRGGGRRGRADLLRRQPRHPHRPGRRPGLGRGRRADRPRPPDRRHPHLRGPPDHDGAGGRRLA